MRFDRIFFELQYFKQTPSIIHAYVPTKAINSDSRPVCGIYFYMSSLHWCCIRVWRVDIEFDWIRSCWLGMNSVGMYSVGMDQRFHEPAGSRRLRGSDVEIQAPRAKSVKHTSFGRSPWNLPFWSKSVRSNMRILKMWTSCSKSTASFDSRYCPQTEAKIRRTIILWIIDEKRIDHFWNPATDFRHHTNHEHIIPWTLLPTLDVEIIPNRSLSEPCYRP